jgi:hypothetical protein
MKILTAGDSFTYGEELSDVNLAWPYRLATTLNGIVTNLGEPAASNDKIIRKTLEYILTANEPVDLVIIAWSNLGRAEYADDIGYYDVWPGYSGQLFQRDGAVWRNQLVSYINQYHNRQAYYKKFLEQVILMQSFLQSKNIKYLMLNTLQNEYYKKNPLFSWQEYFNNIDKEKFLNFDQSGMMEWTYGCKKGPNGHFLEDGHSIVAEKIYEHIRYLGWIS